AAAADEVQLAPLLGPGRDVLADRSGDDPQRPGAAHVDDVLGLGDLDVVLAEDPELADARVDRIGPGVDAGVAVVVGCLPAVDDRMDAVGGEEGAGAAGDDPPGTDARGREPPAGPEVLDLAHRHPELPRQPALRGPLLGRREPARGYARGRVLRRGRGARRPGAAAAPGGGAGRDQRRDAEADEGGPV